MDEIFLRFPHIGSQIFNELDDKELTKCRTVNKIWCKFIDDENIPWNRILSKYPHQDGQSLLHVAALTGQHDTYQKFAQDLKDKNPPDEKARTPLHFAAQKGHFLICQWIISNVNYKNPRDNQGAKYLIFSSPLVPLKPEENILVLLTLYFF